MASFNFEHPKIDWDLTDLYQEFGRFQNHVSFVFDGPLADLSAKQKAGWLGTWIGEQGREVYKTFRTRSLEHTYQSEIGDLEHVSMINFLSVSDGKYQRIQDCTREELGLLQAVIREGWPDTRQEVVIPVRPYWDSRSQLMVSDGIVYKGFRVVVPPSMCKDMLGLIHTSHLGIVKSKQRAREVLYWPGMNSDIEELTLKNCSKCAEFQNKLPREPLKPTKTPELPFASFRPF